jgi:hypothetical protein
MALYILAVSTLGLPGAEPTAAPLPATGDVDARWAGDDLVPTVALTPIASTGPHVVIGSEILIPSGGVTVELEIRAYNLQEPEPNCLSAYLVTLDSASYSSATAGTLAPARLLCDADADCRGGAACTDGRCDVRAAAFIDPEHPDWLFRGFPTYSTVDLQTLDFRYSTLLFGSWCNRTEAGYLGALLLEVSADAFGSFTVAVLPHPDTFIVDWDNQFLQSLALLPCSITIRSYFLEDIALWPSCATAPASGGLDDGCTLLDVNADGDVDLADFAAVQILFSSAGR